MDSEISERVRESCLHYGKQLENWNGVDFSVNARPANGLFLFGGISSGKTMVDSCEIVSKVPESLSVAAGPTTVTRPLEYCRVESPFLTQVKLNGAYTIPRTDVLVSASFQSIPGPVVQANYVVTQRAPGVPLVGSPTATVALLPATGGVAPIGAEYGERLNQLDLRVGKLLRARRTRRHSTRISSTCSTRALSPPRIRRSPPRSDDRPRSCWRGSLKSVHNSTSERGLRIRPSA